MNNVKKVYMLLAILIVGLVLTDSTNAQRGRARGRTQIPRHTHKKPVSAAIDNTVADGPVRIKARRRASIGNGTALGAGAGARHRRTNGVFIGGGAATGAIIGVKQRRRQRSMAAIGAGGAGTYSKHSNRRRRRNR